MGSGEVGVTFDYLLRSRTADQVVIERAVFSAERIGVARLLAEVEPGAPGVVEEKSISAAAADGEKERDALVNRIDRFLCANVCIPECVSLISPVESASLVAQSKIVFVARHGLMDRKSRLLKFGGASNGVCGDDVSCEIADDHTQRFAFNADIERRRAEADRGRVLRGLH